MQDWLLASCQSCAQMSTADLQACWQEEPDKRPDFESIIADLRGMLRCTAAARQRSQALTGNSHLALCVSHCIACGSPGALFESAICSMSTTNSGLILLCMQHTHGLAAQSRMPCIYGHGFCCTLVF